MPAKKKRVPTTPASAAKKKPLAKAAASVAPASPPAATAAAGPPKYSALDAAALVLRESGQPMSCPELITQMAAKGYWSSPQGKTPASTLYAALTREIQVKGHATRFVKTGPGKFACRPAGSSRP